VPRFFFPLPGVSPDQGEANYCDWAIRYDVPVPPQGRRIFRLSFMNPHSLLVAEVGKALAPGWSTVVAIFPGPPTIIASELHIHSAAIPVDCVRDIEYFLVDA
jgi:hypothetical protein